MYVKIPKLIVETVSSKLQCNGQIHIQVMSIERAEPTDHKKCDFGNGMFTNTKAATKHYF